MVGVTSCLAEWKIRLVPMFEEPRTQIFGGLRRRGVGGNRNTDSNSIGTRPGSKPPPIECHWDPFMVKR